MPQASTAVKLPTLRVSNPPPNSPRHLEPCPVSVVAMTWASAKAKSGRRTACQAAQVVAGAKLHHLLRAYPIPVSRFATGCACSETAQPCCWCHRKRLSQKDKAKRQKDSSGITHRVFDVVECALQPTTQEVRHGFTQSLTSTTHRQYKHQLLSCIERMGDADPNSASMSCVDCEPLQLLCDMHALRSSF